MVDLSDYQFELGGVTFGLHLPIAIDADGFDPGTDEPNVQDAFNGFGESMAFGVDNRQPALWTWAAHTDIAQYPDDAVADTRALARAWATACDSSTPGSVAALRYRIAGETRLVFGRPRRFYAGRPSSMAYGFIPVTMDFQRADRLFYGENLYTFDAGMKATENLGFVVPFTFPLTTMLPSAPIEYFAPVVGGEVDPPFEVTIHGPTTGSITNPIVSTQSWRIELIASINAGDSVTVSTYPWGMRALRSDGVNMSGYLSAQSRLSRARLSRAGEEIHFDGIDSTGTAHATLSWRDAYSSL